MNFKIRVRDTKQSAEIQEILFELGYGWALGHQKVLHTNMPFLYLYSEDKEIKFGQIEDNFINNSAEEIEL